ncbi:hypothetical protein DPM19_21560 [Actinomadura craniellae]|uniref:DUF4157 domain-containing protein n=1 Tax=Actinomadura craniellae TaxID=2231787 RepID=A0A365H231_9ACTN|nr:hypothetical protein [Actinomadura craniellae]RAY13086.1 hypothetical protein DPM19_21560 [Actinomadura craniellae]
MPVQRAVNAVAEAASDVLQSMGTAGRNGCHAAGAALGRIPVAGPAPAFVLRWWGSVVSAACDLVATTVKAALGLVAGAGCGAVRLAGGVVTRDARLRAAGLADLVASVAGGVLLVLGKALALLQAILFLQLRERALTDVERDLLRKVYGDSIAPYTVRVVPGRAGLFGLSDRAFVLGDTIYLKAVDSARRPEVFVHECAHVWQYRHLGARYAVEALWAQWALPDAYDWAAELTRGRTRWTEFNREAQAELLADLWHLAGDAFATADAGFTWDGIDRTALARECVAHVRSARARGLSARRRPVAGGRVAGDTPPG